MIGVSSRPVRTTVIISMLALAFAAATITGSAQLFDKLKDLVKKPEKLTEAEAVDGLKEALIQGTTKGVDIVSNVDGYFKNPEIKIPFPEDAKKVENKLRGIGLGKEVDKAVLSINRAAEDAAKSAAPVFVSAIKKMTVKDAINLVKGSDDAATQYLERTTGGELHKRFEPIIRTSLDKVDATKHWNTVFSNYNKIPFVSDVNPDLTDYATGKAIEGLFVMIAKEEANIRKDPLARTTDLLKKVFGQD